MKTLISTLIAISLMSVPAWAQKTMVGQDTISPTLEPTTVACPEGHVCVSEEDMAKFIQLLQERKCLDDTVPKFELDEIVIMTDSENHTYYTGKGAKAPYTVGMTWCTYDVKAEGIVKINVALKEPPVWGFRFRPKASVQYLPLLALFQNNAYSGIDVGVGADLLYWKYANLGVHLGFRSVGLVAGVDITKNFGFDVGWGIAWEALVDPRSAPLNNLSLGFYFAF